MIPDEATLRRPAFTTRKEIHFYSHTEYVPRDMPVPLTVSYDATVVQIVHNLPEIHTVQMALLNGNLWDLGYEIYVHDDTGVFTLSPGSHNTRTSRMLRPSHNLFKMWINNEFKA